jgi:ADP-ribose pyrophosphatase YjhB (NUDIX family)
VREAREETGLDVLIHRLTGVYSKPALGEIVLNFDAQAACGQLVPSEEGVASRFFPLDKLPDQTLPKHVERIRHSAARNGKVEFLVQDSPPGLAVLGFKDRGC